MNTSHFRTKWLRTSGNFAYIFGIAFLIASLFTSLIPPTVAFAHHAVIDGSASCQSNGTYVINWSIKNWSDQNGPMTITGINRSIGVSVGTQVDVNGVTGSETLPNQSATITLTIKGSWTNGNTHTDSKSVKLKGDCYPPPTNTPANTATNTPVTPTNTNTPDTPTNTPETPTNTPEKKITICHVDGQVGSLKYQVLTIGYNAVYGPGGHLNEGGTNQAGHEQDFLIENADDLARCSEPQATPTHTNTFTPTNTPENTSTGTITPTNTPTITETPSNTPTDTPTFTPTLDPVGITFFCTGFRITNLNDFEGPVSYTWSIAGGPSGNTIPLDQGEYQDITTGYYPGLVTVSSPDQQFTASGFLPTNCGENENTPTPTTATSGTPRPPNTPTRRNPTEVVETLIPDPNVTPEILIPVTGVALAGAGSTSRMLFNLGIGLLGLGLVLNGLSRNRKDLEI